jgi:hypothetical protein
MLRFNIMVRNMTVTRNSFVRIISVSAAVFSMSFLAGCGGGGPVNTKVTEENLNKVQAGSTLADIEALLGPGKTCPPDNPSPKFGDEKLVWKRWKHSERGDWLTVGFDADNKAEIIRKKTVSNP